MSDPSEVAPGVRAIDHTADIGIAVRADTLEALFRRAAAGMLAMIREPADRERRGGEEERELSLEGDDLPDLLALWLRELLYIHEVDGFEYRDATFAVLEENRLRARVRGGSPSAPPVRELKGVTYHGLEVAREPGGGWRARVIFDV